MSAPALDVVALHAHRGGRAVLAGIDLRIARGEWLVLVGANGSGKSTLLDCIVGRHRVASGAVAIDGHSMRDAPRAAKARLGYAVPLDLLPPTLSGAECIAVHRAAKRVASGDGAIDALVAAVGLAPWLDLPVGSYSLGTKQKLAIVLALVGEPTLVVLDEAFNGLDAASSQCVKRELHARLARGASVLLATHALDIAEHHADRVVLLHDGRLRREWSRDALLALAAARTPLEVALAEAVAT